MKKFITYLILTIFITAPLSETCLADYEITNSCHNISSSYCDEIQGSCKFNPLFLSLNQTENKLTGRQTREFYNKNAKNIGHILEKYYSYCSLENQAKIAYDSRDYIKKLARDNMKCSSCADYLNKTEKGFTYEQMLTKYKSPKKIIEASQRTRESVNWFSKFSDFFEEHFPLLVYENVIFPLFMMFSRLLKKL